MALCTENNHSDACIIFSNFQADSDRVLLARQIVGGGVRLSDLVCQIVNRRFGQHIGQFVQGGKNGRLMSFILKVEPPSDQTWWDSLVFSILSCFSYVVHAKNSWLGVETVKIMVL